MSREVRLYLADIQEAIRRIRLLAGRLDRDQFQADWKAQDATHRNLEILGEAVKHLPPDLTARHPDVAWKNIAGFRDILAHAYFGVDEDIVWDILSHKLDPLASAVQALLLHLG